MPELNGLLHNLVQLIILLVRPYTIDQNIMIILKRLDRLFKKFIKIFIARYTNFGKEKLELKPLELISDILDSSNIYYDNDKNANNFKKSKTAKPVQNSKNSKGSKLYATKATTATTTDTAGSH